MAVHSHAVAALVIAVLVVATTDQLRTPPASARRTRAVTT